MINVLYGILASRGTPPSGEFSKRFTAVGLGDRGAALREAFLSGIPAERLGMFICHVCNVALESEFGNDIRMLDPENTYNRVRRPAGMAPDAIGLHDLTLPADSVRKFRRYLDTDIAARLEYPEWCDIAGAVCLQLLREAF